MPKAQNDSEDRRSQEVLEALRHPMRRRILEVHIRAPRTHALSPVDVSRKIQEPLSHVSYHVSRLVHFKALALVHEEPVRGAVKHYYRPPHEFLDHPSAVAALDLDLPV